MNSLIFSTGKSTRMDLTVQMKDADEIIAAFRVYNVQFDKKFTSLNSNGPSTITFKGLRTEGTTARLTDMIIDLHGRAQAEKIGNVYVKFSGYFTPKKEKKTEESAEKTIAGIPQSEFIQNVLYGENKEPEVVTP